MRLQQRTTILVVVVFAVLAALVYLVEMRPGQEVLPEEEGGVRVFSFEAEEVTSLDVADVVSNESVLVRKWAGGLWRMTSPFEAEADTTRIDGLLGRLSGMESTRVIEGEDVNLEAFGLDEPSLRVEIGLASGEIQVMLVGSASPAGYSHYVTREGEDRAFLVGSSAIGDLQRLLSEPPEKPTPMPTETLLPTVIAETPTPQVAETPTITPTLVTTPTSAAE
jgi:hypothetical protein